MQTKKPSAQRWKILAVSYLNIVAFALVFQSLSPVLDLIIADIGLSHAEAGALMSYFALPGILISIPAGVLIDRYGARNVGLASLLLMTAGSVLTVLGRSFVALAVGRAVAGTGAFALTIALTQLISLWFKDRELGRAMGVFNTGMPLGTIIALNTLGVIGRAYGWEISLSLSTAFSLLALTAFFFVTRVPPRVAMQEQQAPITLADMSGMARLGAGIWFAGLAWLWANAAGISYLTFGTDYFLSQGENAATAGLLTSFLMMGSLVFSPAIGFMLDRGWSQKTMIIVGSGCVSILYLLIPRMPSSAYLLTVLLGIAVALIPVSVFSLPARILPLHKIGVGFGIISACLNVGIMIGPCVVGLARDMFGGYQTGFVMMSLFGLASLLSIVPLKLKGHS